MRILFYGDSNTYGYDSKGAVPGRYDEKEIRPSLIKERLENEQKNLP